VSVIASQFGVKAESTYGTPVTVDRFYEFNTESLKRQVGRVASKGHRKSQLVQRSDRFMPYVMGAAGSVNMDVPTKGFGLMLKHAFGGAAIATIVDSNYIQTFTLDTLTGLMLTGQFARPLNDGTATPWTYHGMKVLSLELRMDKLDKLVATFEFDAEDEETSTGLATASYTSTTDVFSWTGGTMTIDTVSAEIENFFVKVENPQRTDKHRLIGSALKKQPTRNDLAKVTCGFTIDHTALTNYNKFASATRAGALGAIVATFNGPVFHGGATLPTLTVTIPSARFDAVDGVNVTDWQELTSSFTLEATDDGSAQPITVTYRSTDSAA